MKYLKRNTRDAKVSAINEAERTVELAFSSDEPVLTRNYYEILSHEPGACDLSRLNNGGALLDCHDADKQVGIVERAWIDADRKGRAVVRLSKSAAGEAMWSEILEGTKRLVSVGYRIFGQYCSGELNGLEVVTVTNWQPHEISIVSVPADPSVGIGRNLDSAEASQRAMASVGGGATVSLSKLIGELLQQGDNAQPLREIDTSGLPRELRHLAPEGSIKHIRQPAAASMLMPASSIDLGGLFRADGTGLARIPSPAIAGSTVRLATGLAALSQVCQAGAGIIEWKAADRAVPIPPGSAGRNGVAFMSRPKALRIPLPASFQPIDVSGDTASVTATWAEPTGNAVQDAVDQPHPVLVAPFDFNNSTTLAASWTITRGQRRDTDPAVLAVEIERAIAMGLADAADRMLLTAIAATNPAPFSLAQLASARAQLDDLAAIAGTAAAGAAIGADGVLRVAGVPARLTNQAAGTLVGRFDRAALVIGERFDMHARKLGLRGDLEITVLVDVLPVLADAAAFWKVAA